MKKMLQFNDFLLDILLENKINISFALTDRLYQMLKDITHPISKSLLDLDDEDYLNDKLTLLDYDEDDYTKFTYTIPNKLVDTISGISGEDKEEVRKELDGKGSRHIFGLISKYEVDGILNKNRTSTSINKVVNKLFPNKFEASGKQGQDLESFREMVVSKRKELNKAFERFKIVDGDDIIKYYHYSTYSKESGIRGTSLHGSCMKHSSCKEYLEFYSENKGVKLVILFSEEEPEKIDGRALLWDIEYVDGDEVDKKFMDRIYFTHQEDVELFKSFAKKNGWLNKKSQNMQADERIEDLKNGTSGYWTIKTKYIFKPKDTYPYMDTLKYFYYNDGYLTNNEYDTDYYFLEDTSGGYRRGGGIYVDFYGENIDEEDLIWCELGQEHRLDDDAYWIESEQEFATSWYRDNYFSWSNINNDYIRDENSVHSEYMNDYIYDEDSVEVFAPDAASKDSYKDIGGRFSDFVDRRILGDFILYDTNDEEYGILYFHPDDEDYFVPAYSTKNKKEVNAHIVWDKHRMFKKDGIYYIIDGDQKEIDRIVGQYRLFDNKNNRI